MKIQRIIKNATPAPPALTHPLFAQTQWSVTHEPRGVWHIAYWHWSQREWWEHVRGPMLGLSKVGHVALPKLGY